MNNPYTYEAYKESLSLKKSFPSNLYLVKCHRFYKIGLADNTHKRISQLRVGNPYPIELIATFSGTRYQCEEIEHALHAGLIERGHHVSGEWFELPESVVTDIVNSFKKYSDRGVVEKVNNENQQNNPAG